jgi:hypothetical protein
MITKFNLFDHNAADTGAPCGIQLFVPVDPPLAGVVDRGDASSAAGHFLDSFAFRVKGERQS